MAKNEIRITPENWYSETIWGNRLYDDDTLFEVMSLQVFQAGLSWAMILNKMQGFREAFCNWHIQTVANFKDTDTQKLCSNSKIVRNRLKIEATIFNAKKIVAIQEEHGSFNHWFYEVLEGDSYLPLQKTISALFKFMGPELCRMWLMAAGRISLEEGNKYRPLGTPAYGSNLKPR